MFIHFHCHLLLSCPKRRDPSTSWRPNNFSNAAGLLWLLQSALEQQWPYQLQLCTQYIINQICFLSHVSNHFKHKSYLKLFIIKDCTLNFQSTHYIHKLRAEREVYSTFIIGTNGIMGKSNTNSMNEWETLQEVMLIKVASTWVTIWHWCKKKITSNIFCQSALLLENVHRCSPPAPFICKLLKRTITLANLVNTKLCSRYSANGYL